MWIHHLGTIMAIIFGVLIVAHLGAHMYIKARRKRRDNREQNKL